MVDAQGHSANHASDVDDRTSFGNRFLGNIGAPLRDSEFDDLEDNAGLDSEGGHVDMEMETGKEFRGSENKENEIMRV